MKHITYLILLLLTLSVSAQAQKKGKKSSKGKTPKTEQTAQQKLFDTMLEGTAKVMFIDSIVVDKENFFTKIPMSKEVGTFSETNGQFSYTNELGNHRILAQGDTITGYHLYTTDLLGDAWSKPKQLTELDEDVQNAGYPFLLSDGVTLFFSAKGERSIGGYDIFMTLFNSETGNFYKPKNYGLPFNSSANDYMLVIDDIHALGWLVSDRYQPEDKVCIYTFVPTNPRLNFSQDNIEDERLLALARLTSIQDTWAFGNREAAIERLKNVKQERQASENKSKFFFPINDKIVYTNSNDFKSNKTRDMYHRWVETTSMLRQNELTLNNARQQYNSASDLEKQRLRIDLLKLEETVLKQQLDIKSLEKLIRNEENKLLTH